MVSVDGFKFGRRTGCAPDQPEYSLLSCVAQKRRSAYSDLQSATFFDFRVMDRSLLSMHEPRRRETVSFEPRGGFGSQPRLS